MNQQKTKKEKHTGYYVILEALASTSTCAFCDLETQSLLRYFDHVIYEMVNDPKVRLGLNHSKGYCHRHAQMLLINCRSAFGLATLYQAQVDSFIEYLSQWMNKFQARVSKNQAHPWFMHEGCPACQFQTECRSRHIAVFQEWMHEQSIREAFEHSAGFCIPHFLLALKGIKKRTDRLFMIQHQQHKMEALSRQIQEFLRKHDYRFSNKTMGIENDSWQRAITLVVGQQNLF